MQDVIRFARSNTEECGLCYKRTEHQVNINHLRMLCHDTNQWLKCSPPVQCIYCGTSLYNKFEVQEGKWSYVPLPY